jgi:hypothetical protein
MTIDTLLSCEMIVRFSKPVWWATEAGTKRPDTIRLSGLHLHSTETTEQRENKVGTAPCLECCCRLASNLGARFIRTVFLESQDWRTKKQSTIHSGSRRDGREECSGVQGLVRSKRVTSVSGRG